MLPEIGGMVVLGYPPVFSPRVTVPPLINIPIPSVAVTVPPVTLTLPDPLHSIAYVFPVIVPPEISTSPLDPVLILPVIVPPVIYTYALFSIASSSDSIVAPE